MCVKEAERGVTRHNQQLDLQPWPMITIVHSPLFRNTTHRTDYTSWQLDIRLPNPPVYVLCVINHPPSVNSSALYLTLNQPTCNQLRLRLLECKTPQLTGHCTHLCLPYTTAHYWVLLLGYYWALLVYYYSNTGHYWVLLGYHWALLKHVCLAKH